MIGHNFYLDHIIITHRHLDHIGGVSNVLDMITNKNGNIKLHFIINILIFYFTYLEFDLIFKLLYTFIGTVKERLV